MTRRRNDDGAPLLDRPGGRRAVLRDRRRPARARSPRHVPRRRGPAYDRDPRSLARAPEGAEGVTRMPWGRLGDGVYDHPKIFVAGAELGPDGPAIALGLYIACLGWTSKHLRDGFVPAAGLHRFPHVRHPRTVVAALVKAGLLEVIAGGVEIHDYRDYNETAAAIKQKRGADRDRKRPPAPAHAGSCGARGET